MCEFTHDENYDTCNLTGESCSGDDKCPLVTFFGDANQETKQQVFKLLERPL